MSSPCLEGQALNEVYLLLRVAAAERQPVAAVYDGLPRLFCPHLLGKTRNGELRAFCYQCGGESGSGLGKVAEGLGGWRCLSVAKLKQVELRADAWRTEPRTGQQHCVEQVDFDADDQSGGDPQNGQ
jgi:hypothetical protein